jgi:hypothetical protein
MSCTDGDISWQVSRLLQVHGKDAVECLCEISRLLQVRVDEENGGDAGDGDEASTSTTPTTTTTTPIQGLDVTGSIGNIVIQTLKQELCNHQREDNVNGDDQLLLLTLQQEGVKVLQYCASIPGQFPHEDGIETLCEVMSRHPRYERIQELCSVGLSEHVTRVLSKSKSTATNTTTTTNITTTANTIDEKEHYKILFTVLQAMNWHRENVLILKSGLSILTQFASPSLSLPNPPPPPPPPGKRQPPPPPPSSQQQQQHHHHHQNNNTDTNTLRARQTQIMDTIQLTGGLKLLFQCLKQKHSLRLKRDACQALATLVKDNPPYQELLAGHSTTQSGGGGLDLILDTMRLCSFDPGYQEDALQLLASLAFGAKSKEILLQKGGLDCILTSMKEHWQSTTIQTTACRAVANIFAGTNETIRIGKGVQCIKPLLRAMRMHADSPPVQIFSCAALQTLTPVHATAVSEAGGIATIMVSIQQHVSVPAVQEQAWGTLCNIVSQRTSMDDLLSLCNEDGIPTLLKVLGHYSKHGRIQHNGLGCLACLSAREVNKQEDIMCGKGLDIVLSALYAHGRDHPKVATHGCEILQNLTVTRDFQRAVVAKNGIRTLIQTLQRHPRHVGIQLHGSKCLRNLCLDPDNLQYVTKDGGITTLIDVTMRSHPEHTLINAYSCDALGHLALSPQSQVLILAKNGVATVVHAMKAHPDHKAVQEQGCIFLCNMSNNHNALVRMKSSQVVSILQPADNLLPRSSRVKPRVKNLARQLQNSKIVLSKDAG